MKEHLIPFRGELRTYREIARMVGVSAGTIKSRYHNGQELDAPRHCGKIWAKGRAQERHEFHGEYLTYSEISKRTGLPVGTVKSRIHHGRPIDVPLNGRASDARAHEMVERSVDPELPYEEDETCQRLVEEYGPMTLEEIGHVIGVTRERVRQIELNAIRKLRAHGPASKRLWALVDQLSYVRSIQDARESGIKRRSA